MKVQKLIDHTAEELVRRIQASEGLAVFAKRRAKFEGWLKVELIDILLKSGVKNVVPEAELVDVSFDDVAIELKTLNTSYRDGIAERKLRPITLNVKSVIDDIEKHRRGKSRHQFKYVIFIVFPLWEGHPKWDVHLNSIEKALCNKCQPHFFRFGISEENVSGCLYYGEVGSVSTLS